jgi:hypothetical protein
MRRSVNLFVLEDCHVAGRRGIHGFCSYERNMETMVRKYGESMQNECGDPIGQLLIFNNSDSHINASNIIPPHIFFTSGRTSRRRHVKPAECIMSQFSVGFLRCWSWIGVKQVFKVKVAVRYVKKLQELETQMIDEETVQS